MEQNSPEHVVFPTLLAIVVRKKRPLQLLVFINIANLCVNLMYTASNGVQCENIEILHLLQIYIGVVYCG